MDVFELSVDVNDEQYQQIQHQIDWETLEVNQINEEGKSPLYCALANGNTAMAQALVDHGAKLMPYDKTPLQVACLHGHLATAQSVYDEKTLNQQDAEGNNALLSAAMKGHWTIVDWLIKKGVDTKQVNNFGYNLFVYAVFEEFFELAEELLTVHSLDLNTRYTDMNTLLGFCVMGNKQPSVEWLLEQGANSKLHNILRETPLILAAKYGHRELFDLLLKRCLDDKPEINEIECALVSATTHHHGEIARSLISSLSEGDCQLIHHLMLNFAKRGDAAMLNLLFSATNRSPSHWFNRRYQYDSWHDLAGSTSLIHAACENGKLDSTSWLVHQGASLEKKNNKGEYPIHSAVRSGNLELVVWLVQHGANVNQKTVSGDTPLHLALFLRNDELVRALLDNGANQNIKNKHKQSAFDIAPASMKAILVDFNEYKFTDFGYTPLHRVASRWSEQQLISLLARGDSLTQKSKYGVTPLMVALRHDKRLLAADLLLWQMNGDRGKAITLCKKLIEHNPKHSVYLYPLQKALDLLKRYPENKLESIKNASTRRFNKPGFFAEKKDIAPVEVAAASSSSSSSQDYMLAI